jgi:signal transduction histidine kinase/ligand-binding sensor domain-containing protein
MCTFIAAAAPALRGQLPGPAVGVLDHTVWTVREGAPLGIHALAQAADGVLWFGTSTGLYQFDGVHFEAFEPPASQPLPSLVIANLLALPDSTLWIGYSLGGVSVLSHGRLVSYSQRDGLPEGGITALARDSAGNIWAATTTGLARLDGGRWRRIGPESGYPSGMTSDLLIDRRGTLWAPTNVGVFILPRGTSRFVRLAPSLDPEGGGSGVPREAPDGSVWGASTTLGLTRLSDSAGRPTPSRPAAEGLHVAWGITVDHHANAWVTGPDGFFRVPLEAARAEAPVRHQTPRLLPVERVALAAGPPMPPVLEDREGNIWVASARGIERFRETKLTPVPLPDSLFGPALAPAADGSVWLASYYHPLLTISDRVVTNGGAPADITCAYRDLGGGLWFGGPAGLWHAPAGPSPSRTRFTRVPLPDEPGTGDVQAIAQTLDGDLWVSIRGGRMKGVFRRHGADWSLAPLPPGFSGQVALTVVADGAGRVWLGYSGNRLVLATGESTSVYSGRDGLHIGSVTAIVVRGPRVWLGGSFGLAMLADGRFRSLIATESLHGITGIIETANGNLWLNGADGVTRIGTPEVRRALENPAYRARAERFDYRDGLNGETPQVRPLPTAIQGTDGRLWFTTETSVAWLDPSNIKRNRLPPPVQIRSISAEGRRYDVGRRVSLPVRTTQIQIAYTALSLAMPDRVKFRYRLTSVDTAWAEAGTRREAYYTNLKPGSYRFRVIAANEDDLWNEAGASVDFVIPPTFTQTRIFSVLVVIAAVLAVLLLAQWRQRQIARALRGQFEATLAERARVARELHDTLLQGFLSASIQLHVAVDELPEDAPGKPRLDRVLQLMGEVIEEGRNALRGLRVSRPPDDLVQSLSRVPQELGLKEAADLRIIVDGKPRRLRALIRDEVYRISREALVNAFQHAQATEIEVEIEFAASALRVLIRDDGRGIDPEVLRAGREGHWGLSGMRERAEGMGARLKVWSRQRAGTEIELSVPGEIAFRDKPSAGLLGWWRRLVPGKERDE